MAQYETVIIHK